MHSASSRALARLILVAAWLATVPSLHAQDGRTPTALPDDLTCRAGSWAPLARAPHRLPADSVVSTQSAALINGRPVVGVAQRERSKPPGTPRITLVRSFDGRDPALPRLPAGAFSPHLIGDGHGATYLFWGLPNAADTVKLYPTVTSVWYAVHRAGRGWGAPVRLAEAAQGSQWSPEGVSLFRDGEGTIHVAFATKGWGDAEVVYARLPRRGEARVQRTRVDGGTPYIALATRRDSVVIAYTGRVLTDLAAGYVVHVLRSVDGGATWLPPIILPGPRGVSRTLNLAEATDGRLHLIVGESAARESGWVIRFRHLVTTDWGATWNRAAELAVPDLLAVPSLVAGPCGRLHFVFSDVRQDGESGVTHRIWDNGQWGEPTDPFPGTRIGGLIAVFRDATTVHLITNSFVPGAAGTFLWARYLEPER